jgi:hypothetical protein
LQATPATDETLEGVAILVALTPVADAVVNDQGMSGPLPPGTYMVDILAPDGTPSVSQYTRTDGAAFYGRAYPIEVLGDLVAGEEAPTDSDIVLGSRYIRICRSDGTEQSCKTASSWRKRPFCIIGPCP